MSKHSTGLAAVEYLVLAATLIVTIAAVLNRPTSTTRNGRTLTVIEEKAQRIMNQVAGQLTSPGAGTADVFFEDAFVD